MRYHEGTFPSAAQDTSTNDANEALMGSPSLSASHTKAQNDLFSLTARKQGAGWPFREPGAGVQKLIYISGFLSMGFLSIVFLLFTPYITHIIFNSKKKAFLSWKHTLLNRFPKLELLYCLIIFKGKLRFPT